MNYTNKDIYEALALISRVCESQKDCVDCPFYSEFGSGCLVNDENIYDAPCSWELVPPPEPTKWRPFNT